MAVAPTEVMEPGPVKLKVSASAELVRVAVNVRAGPPTVAVAVVGSRVKLG